MIKYKNYIKENIYKINTKIIIDFIKMDNIIYTKNKNGFFFDLNSFSNDNLLKLNDIIKNNINENIILDDDNNSKIKILNNDINQYALKNKKKIDKNEINKEIKIFINEFSDNEKKIILYSKKYKL
tara:strand:+ start:226 stop:603 length:378 start_codon:yes stop_codon:yes gene_type:complete